MQIDGRLNGHDLLSEDFFIAPEAPCAADQIVSRPRIGVDYSGAWAKEPLRFYLKGNRYVSKR